MKMNKNEQKPKRESSDSDKCKTCKKLLRKIQEIEHGLSTRDTTIEVLKAQLFKYENNYKALYDSYEKLRLKQRAKLDGGFKFNDIEKANEKLQRVDFCNAQADDADQLVIKDLLREMLEQIQACKCCHGRNTADSSTITENLQRNQLIDKECGCNDDIFDGNGKREILRQIYEMVNNNQSMCDTLANSAKENKNNISLLHSVKDELKKSSNVNDGKNDMLQQRIMQLEKQLADEKANSKQLNECLDANIEELHQLKSQLEQFLLLDGTDQLCVWQSGMPIESQLKIQQLESELNDIKKQLLERLDEEDGCTVMRKKIDELMENKNNLEKIVTELKNELLLANNERFNVDNQETPTTNNPIRINKECTSEKYENAQFDLLKKEQEIQKLQIVVNEMQQVGHKNAELLNEIKTLKHQQLLEKDKLHTTIKQLQNRVRTFMHEHDGKIQEIESIGNEINSIRTSVIEDNNVMENHIKELKMEIVRLNKQIEAYERQKIVDGCRCENAKVEIHRLKSELNKKQCIIIELKSQLDALGKSMIEFESTLDELGQANQCLEKKCQQHIEKINVLQAELDKKTVGNGMKTSKKCRLKNTAQQISTSNFVNQTVKHLEMENQRLNETIARLKAENESNIRQFECMNLRLELDVDTLKDECKKQYIASSERMYNLQNVYNEIKNQCDKKCIENERLQNELKSSKHEIDEMKEQCACLEKENENIRKKNENQMRKQEELNKQIEKLKSANDEMKNDSSLKQNENGCLIPNLERITDELNRSNTEIAGLKKFDAVKDEQCLIMNKKFRDMEKLYEMKCEELNRVKKQLQEHSNTQQSQIISSEKYNNLRKEYKGVKCILSEQIKQCRKNISSENRDEMLNFNTTPIKATTSQQQQTQPCAVTELQNQIQMKDQQIAEWRRKIKELTCEVIESRDYTHKLIADNNILKTAINNLIGNLEKKIKGPSFESLPPSSMENVADEFIPSSKTLQSVESRIDEKECDCMNEIISQYNIASDDRSRSGNVITIEESVPSSITNIRSDQSRKKNDQCTCLEIGVPTPRNVKKNENELDSDECLCHYFFDRKSIDFMRHTVKELQIRQCQYEQGNSSETTAEQTKKDCFVCNARKSK